MKSTLLILSCSCLLALTLLSTTIQKTDREVLTYLKEVEWPKAYREQDTVLLDRILAKEFQLISGDGSWSTKVEELAYIKDHRPSYDSFRFQIKRLEIFENSTAIIAGKGHIYASDQHGNKTYSTYHSTNILIKRNLLWKAISSHVSGFKNEY